MREDLVKENAMLSIHGSANSIPERLRAFKTSEN